MGVIYKITNKINGKSYIGQSINFANRKRQHFDEKTWDQYPNVILYKAMRKYGKENFTIDIVDEVPDDVLNVAEKYYIKQFNTYGEGYNMTIGGDAFSNTATKIPVIMYDKNLNYINYFESISETSLYFCWKGYAKSYRNTISEVSRCLSGQRRRVKDYFLFKYGDTNIQTTALVGSKDGNKVVFGDIAYAVDWLFDQGLPKSDKRHSVVSHLKRVVDTEYTYCGYNWRYETVILDSPPVVNTETAALAAVLD